MERVLIIGNGYAGSRAARLLSGTGRFEVTTVCDESYPAYCRHLLPELAAGERTVEELHLPAEDGDGTNAPVRNGAAVARLSAKDGKAWTTDGAEIPFDKALIATGARVFVPGAFAGPVGACDNVFAMRRMGEALALKRILDRGGRTVAIVGAGRIGVLLAEALKRRGCAIHLVDIAPEILATMVDGDVAARLRPHLAAEGVLTVLTGKTVERVAVEGSSARALRFSDGSELACDAVVLATGVVPNTGFLEGEPAEYQGGIPVNERMETRLPGVYAAGDVIRYTTVSGRTESGQLVANARLQAEAAAANIAGGKVAAPPLFVANVVKIGRVVGARAGDIDGTGAEDFRVGAGFLRVTLEGTSVAGFQFVGRPEGLKIAVGGKGGAGKTTVCALLAGILARAGHTVLLVDLDSDPNLASALGFPPDAALPIVHRRELIAERTGSAGEPGGMFVMNPGVSDIAERFALKRTEKVFLLPVGTIETGGEGCFCPQAAFAKALLRKLSLSRDESLVLDLEAGLESFGRALVEGLDLLLIV
ncbi:MAG: FAD-dependent oxidoreductase, partial [Deltaproteobacteria bacterium]|nr:FAD-dependent oxidoreductase [Deltaproteobacteria bacterium]